MSNIPTAEKILSKHLESMLERTDQSYCSIDEMKAQPEWDASMQAMIEFAKLHVEAARFVDKDSILNSYPLENIK